MGDGCGNEAESADEPGSRFGTLEITSRKGGKLQRPVKPEKQGADVSRKTGSHDGPERGWPKEPRGSLEGPRCLFVLSRDGPPGVFKGTSFRGAPARSRFHPFLVSQSGDPRGQSQLRGPFCCLCRCCINWKGLSVVTRLRGAARFLLNFVSVQMGMAGGSSNLLQFVVVWKPSRSRLSLFQRFS